MSKSSKIAAVTLSIRKLVESAMPPGAEVTTLPPALAQNLVQHPRLSARVNVFFWRATENRALRNDITFRPEAVPVEKTKPLRMDLHYLITFYGLADPEDELFTERLFEGVHRVISSNPIIFPTLVPDLPSVEGSGLTFTAQLSWDALSTDEICKIFIALGAEYRPTLPYIVKLSEP